MRLRPLCQSLILTLALSCGDKDGSSDDVSGDTGEIVEADGDTDADADTDTDADADADGDSDADADTDADGDADTDVEDCDDGIDNDADGKKDCKDPDCDAECVEDCSDGKDNDADGDADCDDDECFGDVNCTFDYDITYTVSLDQIYLFTHKYVALYMGYSGAGLASGEVTLSATPTSSGKAFTCTGRLDLGGAYLGMHGLDWSKAGCSSCDFTFYLQPSTANKSLSWDSFCPIETLPSSRIALDQGDYDIQRYDAAKGRWSDQYSAADHSYYIDKNSGYASWWTLTTASSLSFSGAY